MKAVTSLWFSAQSELPKIIFNFTVRYLNDTLAGRKDFTLWNLSYTSDCSFCLQPESLLNIIAGCKTYLNEGRFTWRHDSTLNFLTSLLQCLNHCTFYIDLPQYLSTSLITGNGLRPDMLISSSNTLYVVELSAGFEKNLNTNTSRKVEIYRYLWQELKSKYHHFKFVNFSITALGIFGQSYNLNSLLILQNFTTPRKSGNIILTY